MPSIVDRASKVSGGHDEGNAGPMGKARVVPVLHRRRNFIGHGESEAGYFPQGRKRKAVETQEARNRGSSRWRLDKGDLKTELIYKPESALWRAGPGDPASLFQGD